MAVRAFTASRTTPSARTAATTSSRIGRVASTRIVPPFGTTAARFLSTEADNEDDSPRGTTSLGSTIDADLDAALDDVLGDVFDELGEDRPSTEVTLDTSPPVSTDVPVESTVLSLSCAGIS